MNLELLFAFPQRLLLIPAKQMIHKHNYFHVSRILDCFKINVIDIISLVSNSTNPNIKRPFYFLKWDTLNVLLAISYYVM